MSKSVAAISSFRPGPILEGPAKEMLDRVDEIERTYLEAGELTDAAG